MSNDLNNKIPGHVAVIMDGNGRWAKQKKRPRVYGHRAGVKAVERLLKSALSSGVQTLTIFAFSTENWGRPPFEVNALFSLLLDRLQTDLQRMHDQGICLNVIGDRSRLSKKLCEQIKKAENLTAENNKLNLVVAINYSGRWDMLQAARNLSANSTVSPEQWQEDDISANLSTCKWGDVDLLIRTSGEQRISNFLLWQLAYAEIYFSPVLWPDFDQKNWQDAIEFYLNSERRFGLVEGNSTDETIPDETIPGETIVDEVNDDSEMSSKQHGKYEVDSEFSHEEGHA